MRIILVLMSFFIVSCTTNVLVEGTIPTPLVEKLPARIGVHYPETFKSYSHQENLRENGAWSVDMGEQNLTFFRSLFDAMFDQVVELSDDELGAIPYSNLDGVLRIEILKYGFLTPEISGLKFYSASIHYRVTVFTPANEEVGQWTIVGYGKSEAETFQSGEALGMATSMAIRDGGARITTEIPQHPRIATWIETLRQVEDG